MMKNYEEMKYFYDNVECHEEMEENESLETNERNYNFRKFHKQKEQQKRAYIYDTGYFPTMPKMNVGENGESYYTEGSKDLYKQCLKRVANKKVRQAKVVSNGSHYKKIFDLPWSWY